MANESYIGTGPADRDPTVSDDSVTTSKIAASAVTTAKINDNAVDGAKIALTGNVQGTVMYYNGTDWIVVVEASIPALNVVPTPAVSKFADSPPVICGMTSVLIFNQLIALVSNPNA